MATTDHRGRIEIERVRQSDGSRFQPRAIDRPRRTAEIRLHRIEQKSLAAVQCKRRWLTGRATGPDGDTPPVVKRDNPVMSASLRMGFSDTPAKPDGFFRFRLTTDGPQGAGSKLFSDSVVCSSGYRNRCRFHVDHRPRAGVLTKLKLVPWPDSNQLFNPLY
jgi:hypothetical protein